MTLPLSPVGVFLWFDYESPFALRLSCDSPVWKKQPISALTSPVCHSPTHPSPFQDGLNGFASPYEHVGWQMASENLNLYHLEQQKSDICGSWNHYSLKYTSASHF
ncbi:hypothetical protein ILYODFUR_009431 [Ilyodon furcidens]|uniref:Uncharacterized protein n=2 Tax=Goodeidae TaxID=28758 RepID=A0ABV0U3Y0_9TELE